MKKILMLCFILNLALGADLQRALGLYENNHFTKAYAMFEALCQKNSPKACFSLGVMHEKAQGVGQDAQKARHFYGRACRLGLKKACSNLALSFEEEGRKNEANLAFNEACKLGDFQSCNTLAAFYEGERDGELALYFYQKSCKLKDPRACYKLGLLYERGEWVRANPKKALASYSSSCGLGLGEACYKLGRYEELEKKDLQRAKRYFGMACDKKHQEACAAYKNLNDRGIEIH